MAPPPRMRGRLSSSYLFGVQGHHRTFSCTAGNIFKTTLRTLKPVLQPHNLWYSTHWAAKVYFTNKNSEKLDLEDSADFVGLGKCHRGFYHHATFSSSQKKYLESFRPKHFGPKFQLFFFFSLPPQISLPPNSLFSLFPNLIFAPTTAAKGLTDHNQNQQIRSPSQLAKMGIPGLYLLNA